MKKVLSVLFAILMLLSMVSVSSAEETVVDLSVWGTNNGFLPVEKGSPLYEKYLEITGVGVTQPYVEWNGGTLFDEVRDQTGQSRITAGLSYSMDF